MRQVLRLLVGFAIFSAVVSFPRHQKTKSQQETALQCADPTFACQDLESARLCGVVKSCIYDVWSTMNVPEDDDNICTLCKEMVKEARDQLLSNMTQEEIKEVFEGSCKLLPVKLISNTCIKLVDEFIPELVEMLSSRMDPTMVCTVAGLCNLVHLPVIETGNHVGDDLTCEFCESVLEHVKEMIIANTTEEEFRTALLNFCTHLGKFADKCKNVVDDYFDMLYDFIKKLDTKTVCTALGLCKNGGRSDVVPLVKIFPPMTSPKLIPLVKLLPPLPAKTEGSSHPLVKIIPPYPAKKNSGKGHSRLDSNDILEETTSRQLPLERLRHPLIVLNSDLECSFCRAISFFWKESYIGDVNQESAEQTLANICDIWVKDYPDYCASFIGKYSGKFQNYISEGGDFDNLCHSVSACSLEENDNSELNIRVHLPTNDTIVCDICKKVFNEMDKCLEDPEIKASIEDGLDNICNYCTQKEKCKDLVNSHVDVVLSRLEQLIQGDRICPALKLCPGGYHGKTVQSLYSDTECELCKSVVQMLIDELQDPKVEDSVKKLMLDGCELLPQELSSGCKTFIDKNADRIIKMIVGTLNPYISCASMNICHESMEVVMPKVKDIECDVCKEVVKNLENEIKSPKTEQEITEFLEKVCSYLPSSISAQCKMFVDNYTSTIITLLVEEIDPDLICATLKICTESKVVIPKVKDIECDVCKEVIQNLENDIKDPKTEAEIVEYLQKVCSYLPSSLTAQCKTFVDTYSKEVIDLLVSEVDPDVICTMLKVCTDEKTHIKVLSSEILECDLCKDIVAMVEKDLENNKTEKEIQDTLDKFCLHLPSTLSARCKSFVDGNIESLITLLAQELDPSLVCAWLKACPTKNLECEGCQYLLHFIQNQLYDNTTQRELKALLKKFCSILPRSFTENCAAFLEEYGSPLLVLIAQELDPSLVCPKFGFCNATGNSLKNYPLFKVKSLHIDDCELCTNVVDYIDKLLERDDVDREITVLVEKVCGLVPASLRNKCYTIVDTYGPYILQMIGEMAGSKQVCQDLDLCARPAGHVHLLGGQKCTFGPNYWCKSRAHASACKAETYCKSAMWKN